jgi:hypothetical protein
MKVYIIGALKNTRVIDTANALADAGHEAFADWFSPGPEADSHWRDYETARGRDFIEALNGPHAVHVFEFDKKWLTWADAAVLVAPAGASAHLELGWMLGKGKRGAVLLESANPDRWDVMYRFTDLVTADIGELAGWLTSAGWRA